MELRAEYGWDVLQRLMPICLEYVSKISDGKSFDALHFAADIDDEFKIRIAVQAKVEELIRQGLEENLGSNGTDLAPILVDMARSVADSIASYLQTGDANALFNGLDDLLRGNAAQLEAQLTRVLGIPDNISEFLSNNLGGYALTVYLFAAAYHIYAQAAQDAELARQHRIEVEQSVQAALVQLQESRARMEDFLSEYMLSRLLPFQNAVAAMDTAVLEGDDDDYIAANAELWKLFGRKAQYASKQGFDELMASDDPFIL